MKNLTNAIYALPGWGFSSKLFDLLSTEDLPFIGIDYSHLPEHCIEGIARQLSSNIPDGCHLLGWSLGGLIAIKIASLYPKKVKHLILISCHPQFQEDTHWEGVTSSVANHFTQKFQENPKKQIKEFLRLVSYPSSTPNKTRKLLGEYLLQEYHHLTPLLEMLFSENLRHAYAQLPMNVLHILNREDAIVQQNTDQLTAINPSVKIEIIENSGHAGFIHHAESYRAMIRDTLSC